MTIKIEKKEVGRREGKGNEKRKEIRLIKREMKIKYLSISLSISDSLLSLLSLTPSLSYQPQSLRL